MRRFIRTAGVVVGAICAASTVRAQIDATSVPRKAQPFYKQGLRYEQAEQWLQAYYAFSNSIAEEESAQAWFHRGKAEMMLARDEGAILNDFTHALHL